MLDFHSKEMKSKVLSKFQNKSKNLLKDVSILSFIYNIEFGSKLD